MLLKPEDVMYFLGTIFSRGLGVYRIGCNKGYNSYDSFRYLEFINIMLFCLIFIYLCYF